MCSDQLEILTMYIFTGSIPTIFYRVIILIVSAVVSAEMEPFVVGGDYTDIKEYPHSVLLIVDCVVPYLCGGSVLTQHIILTAGHCLYPCSEIPDFTILIKYGHQTTKIMDTTMVSKFVTHRQYDDITLENDIGMVYADPPMAFSVNVQRVAVVDDLRRRPTIGYVAGWGVINSRGETATNLKHVRQHILSEYECNAFGHLSPAIICAGGLFVNEYPDQGDSGSALVIFDYIQIGIVSFKHPSYGLVGYTNTSYYYKWIQGISKIISCT